MEQDNYAWNKTIQEMAGLDIPDREKILHEICCACIHKPTHYRQSMFEKDKAIQVYGTGCSFGYAEDSKRYCSIAIKSAKAIIALISPLIEDAKKQEREKAMEEEAFNLQCCVSDARRVHPDWTIDDVEELLEFREKTRKAIQSQSGDFIPLEEVRQALKEGETDG